MEAIKKLRSRDGDTLVEVMASIFIFLLMMGILQGAVSYSSASLKKNQQIRRDNAQILEELSAAPMEKNTAAESVTLPFYAASSDLSETGSTVMFRVPTGLYTKQAEDVTFYLYGAPEGQQTDTDTGGETP